MISGFTLIEIYIQIIRLKKKAKANSEMYFPQNNKKLIYSVNKELPKPVKLLISLQEMQEVNQLMKEKMQMVYKLMKMQIKAKTNMIFSTEKQQLDRH